MIHLLRPSGGRSVEEIYLWRPQLKDPSDDMVLELAVTANCKYIITYNLNDFKGIEKFGIQAITPKAFLEMVGEL